ncbi:hypothetical protein SAMN05216331_11930 [Porphyromonadaceae bacterium KH3R12]|nr:hypothetical protein SAMN05216331_11930 [Porphyromonadaceae bacterium KH3R12]
MRLKLENNTIFLFLLTSLNGGGGKSLYNLLKSLRSLFLKRLSSHFICFFSFMSKSVFGVRYLFLPVLNKVGISMSALSGRQPLLCFLETMSANITPVFLPYFETSHFPTNHNNIIQGMMRLHESGKPYIPSLFVIKPEFYFE